MKFGQWRTLIFGLALAFFLVGPALAETGVSDKEIRLGDLAVLTSPVAAPCIPDSMGFKAYWKYINDQGGIHGRKIKVITEDSGYSIPKTMQCWRKLINRDKIFALAGIGTPVFLALYDKIQQEKIPTFPTGQSEKFYNPPTLYIFSLMTSYEDECRILVDYLMEDLKYEDKKGLRIGICYAEDEHGNALLSGVRDQLKKWGAWDKVVTKEIYKRGGVDLSSQALNLKSAKCDLVFALLVAPQVGALIRECDKLDFHPRFVNGSSGMANTTYRIGGKAALGALGSAARQPWTTEAPGGYKMRAIAARTYPDLTTEKKNIYFMYAWVKAAVMAEGLRRAGRDLTREKFIDALETLNGFVGDVGGIIAPVTYGQGLRTSGGSSRVVELVESTGDYTKLLTGLRKAKTQKEIDALKSK